MHGIRYLSPFRKATLAMGFVLAAAVVLFTSLEVTARAAPNTLPAAPPSGGSVPPAVVSIVALDPNPHAFGNVRWTVTFSKPVTGVAIEAFALNSTGLGSSPSLVSVSPAGGPASVYTVTANSGTSPTTNPTLRLDISKSTLIKDAAGNSLAIGFSGPTYSFDGDAPAVTLATVNGATVSFPYATANNVTSVGGACGAASGDIATVNITVAGAVTQTRTSPCTAGAWTSNVALATNGAITVTATQADTAGNTGTSGATAITVDKVAPVVSLTMVNGSTVVNGSTIIFPLTTNVQVRTIGGSCGTLTGDAATVSVTITGLTDRSASAACTDGNWIFTFSPSLLNSPAGANDGDYTITVTQTDTGGNVGTTGRQVLTLATMKFTISGNAVSTLAPGKTSDLNLTVSNPYRFRLKIKTLTVEFTGTGNCNGPANFTVSRAFTGPVEVPAGNSVISTLVAPQIQMLNLPVPQNGCKLASIGLTYNGTASRA